jgi:hypothetical protein
MAKTNEDLRDAVKTHLTAVEHHVAHLHKLLHVADARITAAGLLEPVIHTDSGGNDKDAPEV